MEAPFIAADGCYSVFVLWLDPVDLDIAVADPLDKRYIVNKRSSEVHAKGWECVPAASLDSWVNTTWDGSHFRIATSHKLEIRARQQSWLLLAQENGDSLGQHSLPVAGKRKGLHPGQRKKASKPKKATQ